MLTLIEGSTPHKGEMWCSFPWQRDRSDVMNMNHSYNRYPIPLFSIPGYKHPSYEICCLREERSIVPGFALSTGHDCLCHICSPVNQKSILVWSPTEWYKVILWCWGKKRWAIHTHCSKRSLWPNNKSLGFRELRDDSLLAGEGQLLCGKGLPTNHCFSPK